MIVTCPNCQKKFRLDESRLAGKAAAGKCSECGHRFRIEPPQASHEITCPKCGNKQAGGSECTRCGVVFDKVQAVERPTPTGLPGSGGAGSGWVPAGPGIEAGPGGFRPEDQTHLGERGISIGAALRFGWKVATSNILFFIGVMILSFILTLIPRMIQVLIGDESFLLLFVWLAYIFIDAVVAMGIISVCLKFVDHQQGTFDDYFSPIHLFTKYLPGSILYGLIAMVGFLLLVIPGIIWLIKFGFFGYLIVDKQLGPIEALKGSSRITKGFKIDIFLLGLVIIGINALGALALGVGLLITLPISGLAFAHVYRSLETRAYGNDRFRY